MVLECCCDHPAGASHCAPYCSAHAGSHVCHAGTNNRSAHAIPDSAGAPQNLNELKTRYVPRIPPPKPCKHARAPMCATPTPTTAAPYPTVLVILFSLTEPQNLGRSAKVRGEHAHTVPMHAMSATMIAAPISHLLVLSGHQLPQKRYSKASGHLHSLQGQGSLPVEGRTLSAAGAAVDGCRPFPSQP